MNPIIGITPFFTDENKYSLNVKYAEALSAHGATLLILPYEPDSIDTYLRLVSGIVLTGGGDVDPIHYGDPLHEKTEAPTPARDTFELALCRAAIAADIPLLGICRGAQVMNVALGGNLCQHIDGHSHNDRRTEHVHRLDVRMGSKYASIVGRSELGVNSVHHQCVGDRLGAGVSVCATSPDGIVEAIEVAANKFAIGVQWHPEELVSTDPNHAALFRAFVAAAKV
ncbi:MAG: gamma-glutamyl-gamma-aminobutyrate hydrolase family protein [Defluviitaleaceae bacterium]|nr:gamma-glutamyl-gamma-aminobutyrate hydrolase family protein [Defluviitaleaceae bacterium]